MNIGKISFGADGKTRQTPAPDAQVFINAENAEKKETPTLNTEEETMGELMGKIATAQANNQEYVETSKNNIATLQPRGLGGKKYFIYHGIKVCNFGLVDEIEMDESKTVHDRMHPESQTTVISG